MAQVKFTGILKMIDVDENQARTLSEAKKEFKYTGINKIIELGNILAESSKIDFIIFGKSEEKKIFDKKQENDEHIKQINREYLVNKQKILSMSLEEKSKRLELLKTMYKVVYDVMPDEEILKKAEKIQFDFFEKNPKRTVCNFAEFDIFFEDKSKGLNAFQSGMFKLIERIIIQDRI